MKKQRRIFSPLKRLFAIAGIALLVADAVLLLFIGANLTLIIALLISMALIVTPAATGSDSTLEAITSTLEIVLDAVSTIFEWIASLFSF